MIPYNSDIWKQDSILHELIITDGTVNVSGSTYTITGSSVIITNNEIDLEKFELNQSLCSAPQIEYGSCNAGYIKFTMYENIGTVKGKQLKVYLIPNKDASLMLQLGVFKVAEDKLTSDRTKREVLAYDAMYDILNADVRGWYNTILPNSTSSVTMAQFRTSFLNHFGITAESGALANDLMVIKRTIEPETLSGADVIKAICEINGVFGTITHDNKFRFVELSADLDSGLFPSDTLYPADDLYPQDVNHSVDVVEKSYYIDIQFEDYNSEGITQLTVRTDDEDIGVTVGTAGNRYVITGNFLVYGYNATSLTTVANNILDKIRNRYYRPAVINALGNPLHEVGDGLRIRTVYRGLTTYILERTLTGIQSLRDKYTSQGTQYLDEQLNSVSSQIKQLNGKTLKIKTDVDGLSVDVEDLDEREASHYSQTSGEIALCVTKEGIVGDLNTKMSGITITPDSIQVSSSGTFTVDSTNFDLDSNGDCTLGSVSFTGGEIQMNQGAGLSLFHGGIQVTTDSYNKKWLDIDGYNSGAGSSTFENVAINGTEIHIGYTQSTTNIYHCENIYAGTNTDDAFIRMDDSYSGLRIQGRNDSRIVLDSSDSSYQNWGISLVGDNIDIGISSSTTVSIKNRTCKWESLTMDGVTRTFLVEDT